MLMTLLFEDMPDLKAYLATALENIYLRSVELATVETGKNFFPKNCPYSIEQLLDENFYPE